jgi:hypothetical protein
MALKTMKNGAIVLLLAISGCSWTHASSFDKLAAVFDVSYVNGGERKTSNSEDGPWNMLFSESSPEELAIKNWEEVLGGDNWQLLACRGNVFENGETGFVVGQCSSGPTFGYLRIYDHNLKLTGYCDCQRVVRMKLVDLLGDGVKEIVTWEDHHYGTDTTRRVLAIYKADARGCPTMVFEHNLVDRTYEAYHEAAEDKEELRVELDYSVDFTSQAAQKKIVVVSDKGVKTLYSWNGTKYVK